MAKSSTARSAYIHAPNAQVRLYAMHVCGRIFLTTGPLSVPSRSSRSVGDVKMSSWYRLITRYAWRSVGSCWGTLQRRIYVNVRPHVQNAVTRLKPTKSSVINVMPITTQTTPSSTKGYAIQIVRLRFPLTTTWIITAKQNARQRVKSLLMRQAIRCAWINALVDISS